VITVAEESRLSVAHIDEWKQLWSIVGYGFENFITVDGIKCVSFVLARFFIYSSKSLDCGVMVMNVMCQQCGVMRLASLHINK